MHNFKELKIWQKSRDLVKNTYSLTQKLPKSEEFGLRLQIRKSCISVNSNIAEGSGRGSDKDFCRFLDIAYGLLCELSTQFIISFDLAYITEMELMKIDTQIDELKKMIFGFKTTLLKNL